MQEHVMTSDSFREYAGDHVPVSYSMIVKGNPAAVLRCVDSVYAALFVDQGGDECVILDTGSTDEDFKAIKALENLFPNCRVVDRRDLAVDYKPLCEKHLDSDLFERYAEGIADGRGILSFSEARNICMEACKNDVQFWIDSDDVLAEEEQGMLRKAVNFTFNETPIQQIFMDYDYEFGPDGICTTTLRRERFFRRSEFYWKGNCHETAIPREGAPLGQMAFYEAVRSKIVHTDDRKPHQISDVRNYLILRTEFLRDSANGTLDPRTVFYLGNSARGLEKFKEAISYYQFFDFRSGSLDDRFAAHYYQGQIYMDPRIKRPFDAMDHYFKCIEMKPFDPRGYFGLSRVYGAISRFKECVLWYRIGDGMEVPKDQIFSHDPTHIHYHPHTVAAYAYKEMGHAKQALECAGRAYQFRPDSEEAQKLMQDFQNNVQGDDLLNAVQAITHNIRYNIGPDAKRVATQICEELRGIPPRLEAMGISKNEPPEGRPELPNINFYCGAMAEQWGAFSRHSGIGGSEKMVIILAEALQRTGLVNVNVYGEVPFPARGISEQTGVNWRHFAEFDETRERDVMIFWRDPGSAQGLRCPAKKRVLWNHDVQNPATYTQDLLEVADLIQFQSNFHAAPVIKTLKKDQTWVARNAIEAIKETDVAVERNPKRVLYCSSPDRGLLTATEVVRRAREIDPEIEFVVTYGVTPWARKAFAGHSHRYVPDLGRDVSMDEFERVLHKELDAIDAVVLNRVGFAQMTGLMLESGVWLYPTRFPEISCMSAMEAAACGMVTVATRFGALSETISDSAFPALPELPEYGTVSNEWFDAAAEMLVKAVNVPAKSDMRESHSRLANQRFCVNRLAQDWINKLGLRDQEMHELPEIETKVELCEKMEGPPNSTDSL